MECYVCEKEFERGANIKKVSFLSRHKECEPGSREWAKSKIAKKLGATNPFSTSKDVGVKEGS